MELKKTVSFKLRPKGCALTDAKWPVNNITFVFKSEEDVLNRAVDDAVIALQNKTRAAAGDDMIAFKASIAKLENSTIELPIKGTREASDKPIASAKVRGAITSLSDRFPGITAEDKLEYLTTDVGIKQIALEARFAKKYLQGAGAKLAQDIKKSEGK